MPAGTVRLHRVFRASRERVFRALLDPHALVKWYPPHGFTAQVDHLDPEPGGSFRLSFTNFSTGKSHSFSGRYVELVENERLLVTEEFDDPGLAGQMRTSFTLQQVSVGTDLKIVQEGIPAVIPPEACVLGWQESLLLLAQLVEPEIPD